MVERKYSMNWYSTYRLSTRIISASTVSQYMKRDNMGKLRTAVENHPRVRDFLNRVDQQAKVPPAAGKAGTLMLGQGNRYQMPVRVTGEEDSYVHLERTDGKDWSEIHHMWPVFNDPKTKKTLVLPKTRANLVDQNRRQQYLNWLTYAYHKSGQKSLPKFFDEFFFNHEKDLDDTLGNENTNFNDMGLTAEKFKENVQNAGDKEGKKHRGKVGPQGRSVLQFPNGWAWVSLDTAASQEEGDAAGHCGNTAGPEDGENILSLRDKQNRVHITMVVKNGVTNEIKAPGNKKPQRYTHPYMMALLKSGLIKDVGPGKWDKSNDFHLTDLSVQDLADLSKNKPEMAKMNEVDLAYVRAQGNTKAFNKELKQRFGPNTPNVSYDGATKSLVLQEAQFEYANSAFQTTGFEKGAIRPASDKEAYMSLWRMLSGEEGENNQTPESFLRYVFNYFENAVKKTPSLVPAHYQQDYEQTVIDVKKGGKVTPNHVLSILQWAWKGDAALRTGLTRLVQTAELKSFVNYNNRELQDYAGVYGHFFQLVEKSNGTRGSQVYVRAQIPSVNVENYNQHYGGFPAFSDPPQVQLRPMEMLTISGDAVVEAMKEVDFANKPVVNSKGEDWQSEHARKNPYKPEPYARQPAQPIPQAPQQPQFDPRQFRIMDM